MDSIRVLGTTYTIEYEVEERDEVLIGKQAYTDLTRKKIIMRDDEHSTEAILRHEIIHTFLYESGLDTESWGRNEEIVDWFALQLPKIANEMVRMKCLSDEIDEE